MVFAIHWHESAMDLHVFPIPIPPPASFSIPSLWVFPVHQPWALVSCIQPVATLFYLELLVIALHSSPVVYWTPSDLGSSSSGVLSLCFFTFFLFMGFSQQEYWSGLPFLPPVDHILSELPTRIHPSKVALHGMAHSFTKLCKPLCHDKVVIHEGEGIGVFYIITTE